MTNRPISAKGPVVAAGAVITRQGDDGPEYLLIYRDYRDDWTFPKGKLDPGEHVVAAAVREVREETGFAIRLGAPLPNSNYSSRGTPKTVYYWNAEYLEGEFEPNEEVVEIAWLPYAAARERLTWPHDKEILDAANQSVPTVAFAIMRHTQAMKRAQWKSSGELHSDIDASRPLTAVGRMQAAGLVGVLAAFGIEKLHSSDSRRCRDTLNPYASAREISIKLEKSVSEERHKEHPEKVTKRVGELAESKKNLVLCTHRPVMPTVFDALKEIYRTTELGKKDFDPTLTPGSIVIIHRAIPDLTNAVAVERHIL
jgi:8-oxo-dGTP diphosphatase